MKKSLVLLSMLALSISAFGANVSLPKSVVCQIVLIKKFRLTINRTKRIFLRIKS